MDDLHASGLLDETLVVMMGEFGRTPKIVPPNGLIPYFKSPGRDHWMNCFFGLFAGAGVRGGQVIGRSDAIARPSGHPRVSPFRRCRHRLLGLGHRSAVGIRRHPGRAHRLNGGNVIEPLYTGREG